MVTANLKNVYLHMFSSKRLLWLLLLLQVHLMGKPDPVIYSAARTMLDLAPSEVIAIGDSLVSLTTTVPYICPSARGELPQLIQMSARSRLLRCCIARSPAPVTRKG